MEINIKSPQISTSFKTEKIYPELEELIVKPGTEEQNYSGSYGKINVKEVTSDIDEDIKPENIKAGINILGIDGNYEGVDTSDATATAADIREGKIAYVNGEKIIGTLVLPYTELEYIENANANQYIDTICTASSNIGVELTVQTTTTDSIGFFGAWENGNGLLFGQHNGYYNEDEKGYYMAGKGTWTYSGVPFDHTKFHKFVYDPMKNIITVDGTTVNINKNTGISLNMWLFRAYEWEESASGVRISRCKIYDSSNLIRDFIPVIRNSDNVVCMYDLVEQKFYLNKGTGTFIAGPEI